MVKFSTSEETLGYVTSQEASNTDKRYLTSGSQNVLIDYQKKVKTRSGYTRLGAANTSLTETRNAWTWVTSLGQKLPQKFYDDELEVYLGTIDGYAINAWTRVKDGWSTTEMLRSCIRLGGNGGWYDTTEKIDKQIMVNGSDKVYEWGGGVATALSISVATVTEAGDASNQCSAWSILGASSSNTDSFVLYWGLVDVGGDRTVDVYKDSGGAAGDKVATGTRTGDGVITLTASNTSGITGSVTVAFTTDDAVAAANTLTLTYTVTKNSTLTWAQNHFYTSANKVLVNVRTGYEFTYTGGESTTALTGVTPTTDTDIVANDILIQKVVENDNQPADKRINHFIYNFENQIILGSEDDALIYGSKTTDYVDFTYSSPRVVGEGFLLTLDNPTRGLASIGTLLLIFAGNSSIFKAEYVSITVSTALTETVKIKKIDIGVNQGALNQESIVPIGDALAYLSNEVALRVIENPEDLTGINPKTFSNPIQPDFDDEDWDKAFGVWYKNILIFSTPDASHLYMLNFVQDADGKLFRFWNPPQILPVGPMSLIDLADGDGIQLYGHSNAVPETYLLFDGASDGQYADMEVTSKFPIKAVAVFAYNNFKDRTVLKNFDEYYVEGEITPNTKITMTIDYDYSGITQTIEKTIDGSDEEILEGAISFNSLAQQSLGLNPLGGLTNPPSNARKFRTIFEQAKQDFYEIRSTFETDGVDKYWAIISHGPNATLSNRLSISIKRN